jgi:hypothetical protein
LLGENIRFNIFLKRFINIFNIFHENVDHHFLKIFKHFSEKHSFWPSSTFGPLAAAARQPTGRAPARCAASELPARRSWLTATTPGGTGPHATMEAGERGQ